MEENIYQRYFREIDEHWWWGARKEIISSIIKKKSYKKDIKILDFGSGSGVNIDTLKQYGEVSAYEPNTLALNFLRKKFNITIYDKLETINDTFDLVLMADVLEHIEKDECILKEIYSLMRDNGILIITVPAHQYLFSNKDISLQHFRRYKKKILENKIKMNKFKLQFCSYYNFFLSPFILFVIFFSKFRNKNPLLLAEKKPIKIINHILFLIFKFEKYFLANNFKLPYGISILTIAKK